MMQKGKKIRIVVGILAALLLILCLCLLGRRRQQIGISRELEQDFASHVYDHAEVYVPDEKTARRLLEVQGELLTGEESEGTARIEEYLSEFDKNGLDTLTVDNM